MEELIAGNLNTVKTREDKDATYAAFAARFDDPELAAIGKDQAVAFKRELLKTCGPLRLNKKIGHLSEFFRWAIDNGDAMENPFDGVRIGNKSKLAQQVQSYEPFSEDDLKAIFNPETYPAESPVAIASGFRCGKP